MKTLWLNSIKAYLKLGLFFYFRSIKVFGLENIPKDKPTLILCNHQNALLDALLIATRVPQFAYFLTRAGVFTNSIVSKILNSLNMLPIYRMREGWSKLTNNNPIFERVTNLLITSKTVVIFPEGSHNLARRVRPLSKGFTRIVFDTLELYPELELQLIPIGLNFKNAEKFVDSTSIYIGKPISLKSVRSDKRNDDVVFLKHETHSAISKLTTHIPEDHYDETLQRLEDLNIDFLNPEKVNACITGQIEDCEQRSKSKLNWLRGTFKILLIINLLLPYAIWKFIVEPKIIEIEFKSTFRFGIAIILVPIYLIIVCLVLTNIYGINVAILYALIVIALELLTVKL